MAPNTASRILEGVLTERHMLGASRLRASMPRSLLVLLAAFLVAYAGYWAASWGGSDRSVLLACEYLLGGLLGLAGAIALLRLWPSLEPALPKWFRTERAPSGMARPHRYGLWAGIVLLISLIGLAAGVLIYLIIAVMGVVGGILILLLAEPSVLRRVDRLSARLPWLGDRGTVAILLALLALTVIAAVVGGLIIGLVGSTEGPDHVLLPVPLLVTLSASALIIVATVSLGMFALLCLWRAAMSYRARRGKRYGPRRRALQGLRPVSLAAYLVGMNALTAGLFFFYVIVVIFQAASATQEATGIRMLDLASLPLTGALVDYAALATLALAWALLLLNISATAGGSERRYLNRHVVAPVSVFIVMVLFMHVIVVRGDEVSVSILFRAAYLVGIGMAPIVVFWRRWNVMGRWEALP